MNSAKKLIQIFGFWLKCVKSFSWKISFVWSFLFLNWQTTSINNRKFGSNDNYGLPVLILHDLVLIKSTRWNLKRFSPHLQANNQRKINSVGCLLLSVTNHINECLLNLFYWEHFSLYLWRCCSFRGKQQVRRFIIQGSTFMFRGTSAVVMSSTIKLYIISFFPLFHNAKLLALVGCYRVPQPRIIHLFFLLGFIMLSFLRRPCCFLETCYTSPPPSFLQHSSFLPLIALSRFSKQRPN